MTGSLLRPGPERGFLALVTRFLLVLSLVVCVVVPHSFQVPTAALLVVTALLAALGLQFTRWVSILLILYCLGTVISVLYLFIGFTNGAPNDAIIQSALVYVASPLIWIVISTSLIQRLGVKRTVNWLLVLTWAAIASIVLFFYAYFAFGRESVRFLTEDANINVSGGFAGATMLVYGSMIFLAGAFFAEPAVLRWRLARFATPAALIAAAATSGRAAFLIAIPIGFVLGTLLRPGLHPRYVEGKTGGIPLLPAIGVLGAITVGVVILNTVFTQLDLRFIAELFWEKLTSGGGSERVEQADALWAGIEESYGLGHGHGVGVAYLRSDEFPWRYELLPLASVLRVGILGTLVYALPFLVGIFAVAQRFQARELTRYDIYLSGGLVTATIATFTNPYLESYIFQWMFFLPLVALGQRTVAPSGAEQVPRTGSSLDEEPLASPLKY